MGNEYFHPNRFKIINNDKEVTQRTGISHSLILSFEDDSEKVIASVIIDNPSDKILRKVSDAFSKSKKIKCNLTQNNSLITRLEIDNEEFEF